MIYVLSGDRRDTQAWATANGYKFVEVKHVQNTGSLPGVLNPGRHRIVKLSSYSRRRDHWAIDAKLRQITRRSKLEIEEIDFDRLSTDEPDLDTTPETPDVAESDQEPAEQVEDEPKYDEGELPSGLTKATNDSDTPEPVTLASPPADGREAHPGTMQVGGALPVAPKVTPKDVTSEAESTEKPKKKGRRTNAQIAYDEALVAWESNGGSVEAVKAARAKLKDDDPRLEEDPTEPDELGLGDDEDDLDF